MIQPSKINDICKLTGLGLSQKQKEGVRLFLNAVIENENNILDKLSTDYTQVIYELIEVLHTLDLKDVDLTVIDDNIRD